jgi:hypothetical membrane protein
MGILAFLIVVDLIIGRSAEVGQPKSLLAFKAVLSLILVGVFG